MIRGAFFASIFTGAFALLASPVAAQEGFSDDLETGIDQIIIQPLNEDDEIGFISDGLSLEDLQSLPNSGFQRELKDISTELQERVISASGASVRALDKLTGRVVDLDLEVGEYVDFDRISVFLGDCRYPEGNPSGDAYTYLVVRQGDADDPIFSGWMIASSPALNAMDNARYDIWPLACKTS